MPPRRHVDDAHALFRLLQRFRVQEVGRLFVLRQVNRDEVTLREERIEVHQLHAHVTSPLF